MSGLRTARRLDPGTPDVEAARRLGAFALVVAALATVMGTAEVVLRPATLPNPVRAGLVALTITLAASLHRLISSGRVSAQRALLLGCGYQVVHGLVLGVLFHAASLVGSAELRGWSPVAVWVVLYPLIVPGPPRRVRMTSALTALMDPLGLLVNILAGAPRPPAVVAVQMFLPTLVAGLMVPVAARISYGLTQEVKRAREMGSYRLVERLGEGGMGEVWRAEHRLLARPAAIKLIRASKSGASASQVAALNQRFEREAQATAGLRSPHTIVVYDYGVAPDGTFHYVMELLHGYSLQSLVERFGPVPPARAVHFLLQACHSLAEAHVAGLVHRDIKPANLFACRLGLDVDFVKVLDFGLVKSLALPTTGADALTVEGTFTGTPAYIPPEVALQHPTVDGRADIYALGCVAYWLLTGAMVFDGPTAMAMTVDHVHTVPSPPSQRAPQPIPAALERVVMRCLEKRPEDRPQSAEALAHELRAFGLLASWTPGEAQDWWRAHGPVALPAADLSDAETRDMAHRVRPTPAA